VGKIVAVGRNYAEHVREMGNAPSAPPVLFLKPPSALVQDGGTLVIPADAGEVHHEVELVVVLGKAGKNVPAERALDHVLGYGVGLDMTLRDVQAAAKSKGEPWAIAKGFDTSAAISAVALRERVGDGSGLDLALEINGEPRQRANTSAMLRGVPELIAYASRWMRLDRGDLLFTGTPAGVGPVRPGDRLEARIESIGSLRVNAVAETA
jgi:2-keto-4-pentenoate hydratase/2-oxohepta-3-ene-1,7-dioic acid hydratase in catechol pathway